MMKTGNAWGARNTRSVLLSDEGVRVAVVLLVLSCVLIVTLVLLTTAYGHEAEVRACFNKGMDVQLEGRKALPNGLWGELYRGPLAVVMALSPITGYTYNWNKTEENDLVVEHSEHPVLYWVDFDINGRFDESFIDRGGAGKCNEIEHYQYLDGGAELDENNPRKETHDIDSGEPVRGDRGV